MTDDFAPAAAIAPITALIETWRAIEADACWVIHYRNGVRHCANQLETALKAILAAQEPRPAAAQTPKDEWIGSYDTIRQVEAIESLLNSGQSDYEQFHEDVSLILGYGTKDERLAVAQKVHQFGGPDVDRSIFPERSPDFWRCRTCGCLWRDNHDDTVSLASAKQTSCVECEMKGCADACEPLFRTGRETAPPNNKEQEMKRVKNLCPSCGNEIFVEGDDYGATMTLLPDSLDRPLHERVSILLDRANNEASLAVRLRQKLEEVAGSAIASAIV